MAEEKIKVLNTSRVKTCINLHKFNGREIQLSETGFTMLTADEVAYIENNSIAFREGILKIADEHKDRVPDYLEIPQSTNAMSDEEIKAVLKKPVTAIKKAMDEVTSKEVAELFLKFAREMDKPVKTVEVIEQRIAELTA